VIREVPGAAEVACVHCGAHDYRDPGKPRIAWNDEQARADLVDALVGDALRLLGHLPHQQRGDKAASAVGLLALVAEQDVEPVDGSDGRTAAGVSPARPHQTGRCPPSTLMPGRSHRYVSDSAHALFAAFSLVVASQSAARKHHMPKTHSEWLDITYNGS